MTRNVSIGFLQSYEANPLENNRKVTSSEIERVFSELYNNSISIGFFYKIDK
jgi:hypothetical protein